MNKQALNHCVQYVASWLQYRYEQSEIPGYVVAIAHKGELLLNESYGFANLESKTKLTPQHIFRIASHSKTFTATAIMQLQEQGMLRVDDRVVDYLPWLNGHNDYRWQTVTLRQLLSHSAGIIRDGLDSDYWQLEQPFPDEQQLKDAVMETPLIIDNNTKLKYSNFGYSLLGMVIANVSGMPYHEYVTNHIIKPLGLSNTGPEYSPAIHSQLATGYSRRDVEKQRLPIATIDTQAMAAATGFYATAEDLCRYFSAHFIGTGALLSDDSKKEMQRLQWPIKQASQSNNRGYSLGFDIEHLKKRKTFGHSGGFPGMATKTMADPDNELVVVVLTNCIDGPESSIAKGIYSLIDYYQAHSSVKPAHNLSMLEGRYVSLWGAQNIIVLGDSVIAVSEEDWRPLLTVEKLSYIDEATFKIVDAESFGSEGELVHFNVHDGAVASINYAGLTMWPEHIWREKQLKRDSIG